MIRILMIFAGILLIGSGALTRFLDSAVTPTSVFIEMLQSSAAAVWDCSSAMRRKGAGGAGETAGAAALTSDVAAASSADAPRESAIEPQRFDVATGRAHTAPRRCGDARAAPSPVARTRVRAGGRPPVP